MVNLPDKGKNKERSFTFSGQTKLFDRCHKMLRSISNRSCNRDVPDDTEMYEFIRHTTSEENINTICRSESNAPSDTNNKPLHHQSLFLHSTSPTKTKTKYYHCIPVHYTLTHLKNKIKSSRFEHTNNNTIDHDKNTGFLMVENPDSELILLPNDSIDQQTTQHAQPSVQISGDNFDLNQIQYTSTTLSTINILVPQQAYLGASIILDDHSSNHELEAQSTRSSVECGAPQSDLVNISDTQIIHTISTTSPSSTNSSTHEYTGIDRSILDETEYVRAQRLDLERLTMLEIESSREYHYLQLDLNEEGEFNRLYDDIIKQNLNLKEQLELLKEEHDRIYLPWSCELCTFHNESYNVTHSDVCEVCEGPSPLKRATLTQ